MSNLCRAEEKPTLVATAFTAMERKLNLALWLVGIDLVAKIAILGVLLQYG